MPELQLKDGYYDVPAGKLVSVVTQLEMHALPRRVLRELPARWRLQPLAGRDSLQRYRTLFRAVGEPWLWFSRRVMSDADLGAILDDPQVACFSLSEGGADAGILELDFRDAGSCELAFLGLRPEYLGRGLGGPLLDAALRLAFAQPIARLWVHTCTHDSPAALPAYLGAGFRACGRQIELHDDYRLSGLFPESAAPHVPLLRP
jgi:GNAT superfamily N-acetyltransferase